MSAHKTPGHVCEVCKKTGHNSSQCWTAHFGLILESLAKKKQAAMAATPMSCQPRVTPPLVAYAFSLGLIHFAEEDEERRGRSRHI